MEFVSERLQLAYTFIPKVASTSVKLVLIEQETGEPFPVQKDGLGAIHSTLRKLSQSVPPETYDRLWKFTVVRDPVAKFLSAYGNRVIFHRTLEKEAIPVLDRVAFRMNQMPSIGNFIRNISRYQLLSKDVANHTRSFRSVLGDDLVRFDRVYRIEELNDLAADLSAHIRKDVTFPREQTGGPKVAFADLDRREKAALLKYTEDDYRLLSDFYSPPDL